jgi:acetoacetate decarboxylase
MRTFLPFGVALAKPYRADLFCAWFPDNPFSPGYLEAGLFVHVKAGFGTGIHCPWMVVDDDNALILGRESLGYPKKYADLTWNQDGDVITATANRRGAALIEMTATLGDTMPDKPNFLGRPHRNVASLLGLSLPVVLAFTPREDVVDVRSVKLDLKVGGSERDPLHEMGLGALRNARLHRVNLSAGLIPPLPIKPVSPLYLAKHLNLRVL